MLSGLAANESGTGLDTALCHAGNDLGDLLGVILAAGNIVQEEQRLCANANDVVDAHSNGINADGVMFVHQNRQLHLGAAAVGAGDQHRLLHTCNGKTKAAAEATHIVQAAFIFGAGDVLFHQFNSAIAGNNVNAGGSVAGRLGVFMIHGKLLFRSYFQHCCRAGV